MWEWNVYCKKIFIVLACCKIFPEEDNDSDKRKTPDLGCRLFSDFSQIY